MLDLIALGALNHLLAAAPWACARLRPFAGQRARIVLAPRQLEFRIAADGTLESLGDGDGAVEVEIVLSAEAWRAAPLDREAMLRGARVSGSAGFAEALGFVLRKLQWDAEEDLSRIVGDIAARRLARMVRGAAAVRLDFAQRVCDQGH